VPPRCRTISAAYRAAKPYGGAKMKPDINGELVQHIEYVPYGETFIDERRSASSWHTPFLFCGKERDEETGLLYVSQRYQDGKYCIWYSVDPLALKYPNISSYVYCHGNPIRFIDPDGREPILPYVGTAGTFIQLLYNSPRGVGNYTGGQAASYLRSLSNTEWNWKQMRPLPTQTGYFNMKPGRYIYTEKSGWLDMAHFMFYAGKAYDYKLQKESAQKAIVEMEKAGGFALQGITTPLIKQANINPVGEAVQDGYMQERTDKFAAKFSAYSYEDLPSDKFGAEFGANYFDPNSKLSFGQQLQNYLNGLGATTPQKAPNYKSLPATEPTDKPTRTNNTTTPVYTKGNP
jgi:RHS repeat-associated protein